MASKQHGERYTLTLTEFEQRSVEQIAREKGTTPKQVIRAGIKLMALAHKAGLNATKIA